MVMIDFIVTIRTDQQQTIASGAGQEMLQPFQARPVYPLQVIKKHYQRMLLSGKDASSSRTALKCLNFNKLQFGLSQR
jgi:hypothetical protein